MNLQLGKPEASTTPSTQLYESEASVLRDIYYMKVMAVEAVTQLALDSFAVSSGNAALSQRLIRQVQEEWEHLEECRSWLALHNQFAQIPDYVGQFARIMRRGGGRRQRTLALAAAVVLCTAVERSALQQLANAHRANAQVQVIFEHMSRDEEEHYSLVSDILAPLAAQRASAFERARAYWVMSRVSIVAVRHWWPRRISNYCQLGLDINRFVREVLEYSSSAFSPLKIFFPKEVLSRLIKLSLHLD
jgi:hypothetical protein